MEKLTRRSAYDATLLRPLLNDLGSYLAIEGRDGMSLGAMAMAYFLYRNDDAVLQALSKEASSSAFKQQHALFQHYAEEESRMAVLR